VPAGAGTKRGIMDTNADLLSNHMLCAFIEVQRTRDSSRKCIGLLFRKATDCGQQAFLRHDKLST